MDLNYVDAIKTDGNEIYWTVFDRDLSLFGGNKTSKNINDFLNLCPPELKEIALDKYYKVLDECINRNWVNKKLLG